MTIVKQLDKLSQKETPSRNITEALDAYFDNDTPSANIKEAIGEGTNIVEAIDKLKEASQRAQNITQAIDKYREDGQTSQTIEEALSKLDKDDPEPPQPPQPSVISLYHYDLEKDVKFACSDHDDINDQQGTFSNIWLRDPDTNEVVACWVPESSYAPEGVPKSTILQDLIGENGIVCGGRYLAEEN